MPQYVSFMDLSSPYDSISPSPTEPTPSDAPLFRWAPFESPVAAACEWAVGLSLTFGLLLACAFYYVLTLYIHFLLKFRRASLKYIQTSGVYALPAPTTPSSASPQSPASMPATTRAHRITPERIVRWMQRHFLVFGPRPTLLLRIFTESLRKTATVAPTDSLRLFVDARCAVESPYVHNKMVAGCAKCTLGRFMASYGEFCLRQRLKPATQEEAVRFLLREYQLGIVASQELQVRLTLRLRPTPPVTSPSHSGSYELLCCRHLAQRFARCWGIETPAAPLACEPPQTVNARVPTLFVCVAGLGSSHPSP